jgi:hypothetical protein
VGLAVLRGWEGGYVGTEFPLRHLEFGSMRCTKAGCCWNHTGNSLSCVASSLAIPFWSVKAQAKTQQRNPHDSAQALLDKRTFIPEGVSEELRQRVFQRNPPKAESIEPNVSDRLCIALPPHLLLRETGCSARSVAALGFHLDSLLMQLPQEHSGYLGHNA